IKAENAAISSSLTSTQLMVKWIGSPHRAGMTIGGSRDVSWTACCSLRPAAPTAVIAGPDPAIHAVPAPQIEVVLRGMVTAWMPWSSHGMTEGMRGSPLAAASYRVWVGHGYITRPAFLAQVGSQ
ncbi:MAG: hypothetical protein ABJH93_14890, partial [Roseibium sp.]|uniref:hypothetical protein n=1 Tax=Roseibium sp. TaxID=1936156 RepID=UPI003299882F